MTEENEKKEKERKFDLATFVVLDVAFLVYMASVIMYLRGGEFAYLYIISCLLLLAKIMADAIISPKKYKLLDAFLVFAWNVGIIVGIIVK